MHHEEPPLPPISQSIEVLEEPSTSFLREARLNHFIRTTHKLPIRFRHSIGSPSLLHHNSKKHDHNDDSINAFGNDEVERFFELYEPEPNPEPNEAESKVSDVNIKEVLEDAKDDYECNTHGEKYIIVQRDTSRFWHVLSKLISDLQVNLQLMLVVPIGSS